MQVPGAKRWVVKLGGSLCDTPELGFWLHRLAADGAGRVVLVPGGGPFADQVRHQQAHWKFDDATAHDMALHAMDQYGLMLCALQSGLKPVRSLAELDNVLFHNQVAVWLPTRMLLGNPVLPASWDVTSDTIAAWLARQSGAHHLLLIKRHSSLLQGASMAQLQAAGIVDRVFKDIVANADFQCSFMGGDEHAAFSLKDRL